MASPLQILGDIGGGLSTIGAQGSGGAYEGVLEGEALKRRFSASDADTNLRILQGLLMQQQLGPQYHTDPQGRILLQAPGQPPKMVGELPIGQYGQARIDLLGQQTKLNEQKAALAEARLQALQERGGIKATPLETYRSLPPDQRAQFLADLEAVSRAQKEKPEAPPKPAQNLELPVRTQLMGMGIDPETATPAQIKAATEAVDARMERRVGASAQTHADVTEASKKRVQTEKDIKGLAGTETLLNQLEALIPAMEKKGFLASGPGAVSMAMAEAKRSRFVPGYGQPGDEDLAAWKAHAGTMVRILRDLGDIGPRAISAYQSAIDIIEKPTTAAGARKVFEQLREAVRSAKSGQVGGMGVGGQARGGGIAEGLPPLPDPATRRGQTVEDGQTGLRFYSDGLAWHRAGGAQSQPAGPGASQGASVGLPKGAHREGGEIISDSGKYVWRNGAWQAR